MVAILLPLLAGLTCAPGPLLGAAADVCPELRTIRTELLHIHRHRGATNEPMVSDARLEQIERRLGRFLGLPPSLRVRLTTISGHRREMAKPDGLWMTVVDRSSGLDLGMWTTPWSGECLSLGGLLFLHEGAATLEVCGLHKDQSHYPRALLPRMFEELGEVTEGLEAASYSVEGLRVYGGGAKTDPPFVNVRGYVRVDRAASEAVVSSHVQLLLEETKGEPENRVQPPRLDELLTVGLELLESVELSFPHSIQANVVSADTCRLTLDPYKKEHRPLPLWVDVHRFESEWSVSNPEKQLARGAVDLARFARLANLVADITARRDENVGTFGIALDSNEDHALACLVTIDADSIWEAKKGRLHLIRASESSATIVREVELSSFEELGDLWSARKATTEGGEVFFIEGRNGDHLAPKAGPPVLRFGEREFAVLGGRALR